MKKTLITLFVVTLCSVGAFAQQKGVKKHRHGQMAAQLNLSEQQKKQAEVYRTDFRKKMQDLNKLETITVKEQRDRREVLKKDMKQKMDGLLTAEQKTTMARLKTEQKAKNDLRRTERLNKMKVELSLSEAQVSQLKKMREDNQAKMMALKENNSLTREQRKEKMMAIQNDMKAQRSKIFTAEQQKKMEELKQKHLKNKPAR